MSEPVINEMLEQLIGALGDQDLKEFRKDLINALKNLNKTLGPNPWQIVAAVGTWMGPIVIAVGGRLFALRYNERQDKLRQLQTIGQFIPYLTNANNDQSEFAVRMITALGDPKLSSEIAKVSRSRGATIAQLASLETAEKALSTASATVSPPRMAIGILKFPVPQVVRRFGPIHRLLKVADAKIKAEEEEKNREEIRMAKESLEMGLCYQIEANDAEMVTRILQANISPNTVVPGREAPLIVAVRNRHAAIVKLLLKYNAEPKHINPFIEELLQRSQGG